MTGLTENKFRGYLLNDDVVFAELPPPPPPPFVGVAKASTGVSFDPQLNEDSVLEVNSPFPRPSDFL